MVARILSNILRLALPVGLALVLARQLGPVTAALVVAGLGAVAAALGAFLLKTSRVGEVTWRNVAASWLMPWAFAFGARSLPTLAATSAVMVAAAGCLGAFGHAAPLLVGALALDAAALLYLARGYRLQSPGSSARASVLKTMVAVAGLGAAGVTLHALGRPTLAALVAGGPLSAIGAFYGLWILVLLTFGRNARWN